MSIKVLYDHQIFTFQKYGGISRYFSNLIRESEKSDDISAVLGVVHSSNTYISRKNFILSLLSRVNPRLAKSIEKRFNKSRSNSLLQKGNYDVFHPTEFNHSFLKTMGNKPLVITIFDMIPEKFPEHFNQSNRDAYIGSKRTLIQKADKIISISNTAKEDILTFYKLKKDTISVIHLAGNRSSSVNNQRYHTIPKDYLLYVGTRNGYKNFIPLIKSISSLLKSNELLHLVCCGGGKFSAEEMQVIMNEGINSKVIHLNNVSDYQLSGLYHNAIAFIFPSIYEGFGIPILEAASAKCPLILSDNTIFHEVAGDAAIYFDPLSNDSMAANVSRVVSDTSLQKQLKEKSATLAKKYSWEQTFNKTKEVYQSLV